MPLSSWTAARSCSRRPGQAAHLDLADDQHGCGDIVGHELVDAEVCLTQAWARAVPADNMLPGCGTPTQQAAASVFLPGSVQCCQQQESCGGCCTGTFNMLQQTAASPLTFLNILNMTSR